MQKIILEFSVVYSHKGLFRGGVEMKQSKLVVMVVDDAAEWRLQLAKHLEAQYLFGSASGRTAPGAGTAAGCIHDGDGVVVGKQGL